MTDSGGTACANQAGSSASAVTPEPAACAAANRIGQFSLVVALAVGLALRLHGITFGLPDLRYGDEVQVINHSVALGDGDINPHFFVYPSLIYYLNFFLFGVYFATGYVAGVFDGLDDFATTFFTDASPFYLIARLLTVAFALATIVAVHQFGMRLGGPLVAGVAALLVAVNPVHVLDSHLATPDVLMGLFVVLASWSIDRIMSEGSWKDYVGAGISIGLGAATKYLPVLLLIPLLLAHVYRATGSLFQSRALRVLADVRVVVTAVVVILAFVAACPFCLIDWEAFIRDNLYSMTFQSQEGKNLVVAWNLLIQLGWPLAGVLVVGSIGALWARNLRVAILLVFPLTVLGFHAYRGFWASRYLTPLFPLLLLVVAYSTVHLAQRFRRPIVFVGLVMAVIAPAPISASLRENQRLLRPSTYLLARDWVEANVGAGARVVTDPYVPLKPNRVAILDRLDDLKGAEGPKVARLRRVFERMLETKSVGPQYYLLYAKQRTDVFSFGLVDFQHSTVSEYLLRGAEYFVLSVPRYGRGVAGEWEFSRGVENHGQLVQEISSGAEWIGPRFHIYRVRPTVGYVSRPGG